MLTALTNALAGLVALEARAFDLVQPDKNIAEAVKVVVKELAVVLPQLVERLEALEKGAVAASSEPPKVGDHVRVMPDAPATAAPAAP